MASGTRTTKARKKTKQTPAEALHGSDWVKNVWEAARGILKGKGPKDPVAWQRKIRKEWESSR